MAKSISLLLLDDKADGRIKCTIKGRSGVIFKIPRESLNESKNRDDLNRDGIYFLLGKEDDREKIYVGQASTRKNGKGILGRLNEHDRSGDKNFWTNTIIFTDNSFGATELNWLENKFCNMAIKAARYEVTNGNEPPPGNISEEKEIELEEQVEFVLLILGAIGYKIFEPQKKVSPPPPGEEIFQLSRLIKRLGRTVNAQMKRTPTGYKVLAGSEISPLDADKLSAPMKKLRHSEKVANGKLIEDIEFSSPTSAAEFVIGNNANGWEYWKLNGVSLKNLQ